MCIVPDGWGFCDNLTFFWRGSIEENACDFLRTFVVLAPRKSELVFFVLCRPIRNVKQISIKNEYLFILANSPFHKK